MTKASKKTTPAGAQRPSHHGGAPKPDEMADAVDVFATEAGQIGKIRDILFGNQMADYDKRFTQLESRITSQVDALGSRMSDRLKEIETLIQKKEDGLTARLDQEQSQRSHGAEALSEEIADAKEALFKSIDAMAAQQAQDIEAVHSELKALSHQLSDEIHIQQAEAAKNLDLAVQTLDKAKLARKSLSQMLLEMAGRLSDEPA